MAWNGSDQTGRAASMTPPASRPRGRDCPNRVTKGRNPSTVHLFSKPIFYLTLLLLALVGAAVWYFLRPPAPQPSKLPPPQPNPPSLPAATNHVRTNRAAKVEKKAEKPKKLPYWERPTMEGLTVTQCEKWKLFHKPPTYTNTTALTRSKSDYEIFPTAVENEIACLMTLKPGSSMIGMPMRRPNLNEDFLKSCETLVLPTDEDTEYQRTLKLEMNQVKIELRQRISEGEDLGQILADTRRELQRMANVKAEIENDVRAMIKSDATSANDIETYVEAANKMLEEKGIAPMKLNPITRRALERFVGRKNTK